MQFLDCPRAGTEAFISVDGPRPSYRSEPRTAHERIPHAGRVRAQRRDRGRVAGRLRRTVGRSGTDARIRKLTPTARRSDVLHGASHTGPASRLGDRQRLFHGTACRPITGDFATAGQRVVIAAGATQVGLLHL